MDINLPSKLETNNTYLNPIHDSSVKHVYDMFDNTGNEEYKYISIEPIDTMLDAENFITNCENGWMNKENALYLIYIKESNEPIGFTGFWNIEASKKRCEIGIFISKSHWGSGYATECLKYLLNIGFIDLDMSVIRGITSVKNDNAIAVCENVFEKPPDSILPNEIITKENVSDAYQFYLRREDIISPTNL
jgi:RimJ/RimL family protein N-acetyltransferase